MRSRFLLWSLIPALLSACGGGGGGSGTPPTTNPNAILSGTYQVMCLEGDQGAGATAAAFGSIEADGNGSFTALVGNNENGTVNAPMPDPAAAYSVAADGTLSLGGLTGWVRADGEVAVLTSQTAGDAPMMCVLIRRDGAYDNGTMNGNYHMGMMQASTTPVMTLWTSTGMGMGRVAFDGMGGRADPEVMQNVDGGVGSIMGGMTGYAIAADGVLTIDPTWVGPGQGAVASDGAFACRSGSTSSMSPPHLEVLVAEGAGMTSSALSGTYRYIAFGSDPDDFGAFRSVAGRISADGAGTLTQLGETENREGVIGTDPGGGAGAYTVSAIGILNVGTLHGAISPDGRFGFLAGNDFATSDPEIVIIVRE